MRSICVLAILLSLGTGAAAGEYYVVQDVSTRQCTVAEVPPTTTQVVVLEKGKVFSDRDEAKAAAASPIICSSRTASGSAKSPGRDEAASASKLKAGTVASRATSRHKAASAQSQSGRAASIAQAQSGASRQFPSFFSFFR